MSIKEKIARIKDKAAHLAVKTAAVATLMTGTGAVSSCQNQERYNDEDLREEKTSVVFRSTHNSYRFQEDNNTDILLENGDEVRVDENFLEPGDTVTYEKTSSFESREGKQFTKASVKAVRYKDGTGKNINFGRIGKIGKDSGR